MAQQKYYPEEILVEKMQSSEYGWLDYINHFSAEWQEEYAHYCEEKRDSRSAKIPPPGLSVSKTNNWKRL